MNKGLSRTAQPFFDAVLSRGGRRGGNVHRHLPSTRRPSQRPSLVSGRSAPPPPRARSREALEGQTRCSPPAPVASNGCVRTVSPIIPRARRIGLGRGRRRLERSIKRARLGYPLPRRDRFGGAATMVPLFRRERRSLVYTAVGLVLARRASRRRANHIRPRLSVERPKRGPRAGGALERSIPCARR